MAFRAAEYEAFEGERSRMPVWWPVLTSTLRRGWGSKWVRRITFLSMASALGITVMIYFLYQVVPNWREMLVEMGNMVLPENQEDARIDAHTYLGLLRFFVFPILLPLSLVFGYDLISADLRANAFESYFSRSITPAAYILGRTLAYVGFMLLVTLMPMLWIWAYDVLTGPDEHFAEVASVPLGMTAAMFITSLALALMIQAVTAITKSGIWTNLTFVAIFIFTAPVGGILFELSGENANFFALSILHCIHVFTATCLGVSDDLDDQYADPNLTAGVLFLIIFLSLLVLLQRLRKRSLVG